MKLLEHQGLELFEKYGIPAPKRELLYNKEASTSLPCPLVLKSQVYSGDRAKHGGIAFVESREEFAPKLARLFETRIEGSLPESVLAEEKVPAVKELYASFSYDTAARSPALSLSAAGGSGISRAHTAPVDILWQLPGFFIKEAAGAAGIEPSSAFVQFVRSLWKMFQEEQALLAEINPLFQLEDGSCVAGDAKVILDDNVADPEHRPFVSLEGDIALIASGGGASMINLDALLHYGGKPANYVEYSGNPPAEVVEELTLKVLSKPGLKGCWVVGGTANFTDIYETLSGFVQGLRKLSPKPTYPIVIRRDGPRREEAFAMLKEVAEQEGYNFHVYGPEIPMAETARIMAELAYGNSR